ncbi:hypothetical protein BS639_17415 [Rouxiella silvae]|uniref:Uncharacterized protein n=1 Tax=Rouxiella silvae TaxID=1646373 RepID=A0ABX3TXL6_9GAMM|nr:hypothetical protein [Rouxiella silvae]ORJ19953.1 hypothetical protein BS639_17415 [Rouxiella silvae]
MSVMNLVIGCATGTGKTSTPEDFSANSDVVIQPSAEWGRHWFTDTVRRHVKTVEVTQIECCDDELKRLRNWYRPEVISLDPITYDKDKFKKCQIHGDIIINLCYEAFP